MVQVVVIGAGPYGLSVAAHLRGLQIPFRVVGKPMTLWRDNMPKGMLLKSDGFATNLAAPANGFPLHQFYRETGRPGYSDIGLRVPVETLIEYGLEFQRRHVGAVDEAHVADLRSSAGGFDVVLDTGEHVSAQMVVVATGPLAFRHVPEVLEALPPHLHSHSSDNRDLSRFAGRRVTVVGGGQSALETAALLRENGASVTVLTRRPLRWFDPDAEDQAQSDRALATRIRRPNFGLGPGWRTWFWSEAPQAYHRLPARTRREKAYSTFGPAGSGWLKHRVDGVIPVVTGTIRDARERAGQATLSVDGPGGQREQAADHVIAATGYKADIRRLAFLRGLLGDIRTIGGAPELGRGFESSVPRLHFVGYASAPSFGPSMRFIYGTRFAATRLAQHLSRQDAGSERVGGLVEQQAA